MQKIGYDAVIVGAGFAGAVMAERLASGSGKRVLVIDRRPHIAGNAFDHVNADGILVHAYGPHIFHTNSQDIVDYLSRFTAWRPYEHRVLASVDGKLVPVPINRTTLNGVFGLDLATDDEAADFLKQRQAPKGPVVTSEDVVLQAVGRELYEMFFRGYTRKQWGRDPSELDRSVTARIPTRTNTDDRYFTDHFQAMPRDGYAALFAAMLNHPGITVQTATDFADVKDRVGDALIVYTGQIDAYFDYRFGALPYRSLRFEHETLPTGAFQPSGTVNYPSEAVPYTRISEFKHLTGQEHEKTSIVREYPAAEGDPYYPVPTPETAELYRKYAALAEAEANVLFVGRLATYQYYNMDQIVGQALATYRRWAGKQVSNQG
jgi:UDP-galactopyranose mutase